MYSAPSSVTMHVWMLPHTTLDTMTPASDRLFTSVGLSLSTGGLSSKPPWPCWQDPKAHTAPLVVRAAVCLSPQETWVNLTVGSSMRILRGALTLWRSP